MSTVQAFHVPSRSEGIETLCAVLLGKSKCASTFHVPSRSEGIETIDGDASNGGVLSTFHVPSRSEGIETVVCAASCYYRC